MADVRAFLEAHGLNTEANGSNEIVLDVCPNCDASRKCYVNADEGVFDCKVCGLGGSFRELQKFFQPPVPTQVLMEAFHESAIRNLLKSSAALTYLEDRGIEQSSIAEFRYGYADPSVYVQLRQSYSDADLRAIGLVGEYKGQPYDMFFNHIIIPYVRSGEYVTFQGRDLDPQAKRKYVFATGMPQGLYHPEDLYKRGRVFLTEGAFKRDALVAAGHHAAALPGANDTKRYIAELDQCEDLWIILDADAPKPNGKRPGQDAATKIAKSLKRCTVLTLPLAHGQEKIGVDDFLNEFGAAALDKLRYVTWKDGKPQRPTNLAFVVRDWREQAMARGESRGLLTGHERFDSLFEGFHDDSLVFIAGASHMGKTAWMEDAAQRVYKKNPEVRIDYYSNDDSLYTTIARWVAKLGQLRPKDCRYPMAAFGSDEDMMARFDKAVGRLTKMSDRMTIVDSSYNVALETLGQQLIEWRAENPTAKRIVFIDAFRKTKCRRDGEIRDELMLDIYKSSLLKEIAQGAHIPIVVTHEVPKLSGKRPNTWNLRGSGTLEYDADVLLLCYQEAHVLGIDKSEMFVPFEIDGRDEKSPVLEVICGKDKICGTATRTPDFFALVKSASAFQEVCDEDYDRLAVAMAASERREKA